MTFATFAESPGAVLDRLRIGTVIDLTRRGATIARITGVRTATGEVWTVTDCTKRAALRRKLLDGGRVVVSRDGLIEAVLEGVKA